MSLPERENAEESRPELMTDVLGRIQAELEDIARRIDRNQAMIANATWSVATADAEYVRAMQDADLNAQRIAGVASFLRAIGDASPPNWRVDTSLATDTLKLTELVRSIGLRGQNIQSKNEDAAGDVDFF